MARGWRSRTNPPPTSGGAPLPAVSLLRQTKAPTAAAAAALASPVVTPLGDGDRAAGTRVGAPRGSSMSFGTTCVTKTPADTECDAEEAQKSTSTCQEGESSSALHRTDSDSMPDDATGEHSENDTSSSTLGGHTSAVSKRSSHRRRRQDESRVWFSKYVNLAHIPPLSELPSHIKAGMYYTSSEEARYRSDAKDEIRMLRRHPAVVEVNRDKDDDLFAPRDYHRCVEEGEEDEGTTTTRGVEQHLLPRDLRRHRSALLKDHVEAILVEQYQQQERREEEGCYEPFALDDERLARVSKKLSKPFRRRARDLALADEAEMVQWLPSFSGNVVGNQKESTADDPPGREQEDDCSDFHCIDSYASLDARVEAQFRAAR